MNPDHEQPRVVIAGFGLLTPLGHSGWETFSALLAGRTIADRCEALPPDVALVDMVRAIGSVRVAHHAGGDPALELAERAVREACVAAKIDPTGLPAFLGTSKGAAWTLAAATERFIRDDATPAQARATGVQPLDRGSAPADLARAVTLGPHGYLTAELRRRLGLGLTRHHVAACASGLAALDAARRFLLHDPAAPAHALAITAEAALLPVFIHSYRRLGVLAGLTPADYRERPLDAGRTGFTLSEAGAAVLLRRLAPGREPDIGEIELLDTAVAAETFDLIRPSPDMPALHHVAERLFAAAAAPTSGGSGGGGIDVIHPHAPGTADHDPAELAAYASALRLRQAAAQRSEAAGRTPTPDLYAAKGAIGHSLGAAGLSAFVLACLCLTTGRRPPMPWLTKPLPWPPTAHPPSLREGQGEGAPGKSAVASRKTSSIDLAPAQTCSRTGTHAIFAAGFAGHTAGALIRRW